MKPVSIGFDLMRSCEGRESPLFESKVRGMKVDIEDDWSTGTRFYTFSDGSRLSASEGFLFYAGKKGGV